MDDDDQDDFHCQGSDGENDDYTDSEDNSYTMYQSSDKLFDTDQPVWKKFSFVTTLMTVIISATVLIISYPLYLESVSRVSNAYTGLLFVALGSVIVLGVICIFAEKISPSPDLIPNSLKVRVPQAALLKISSLYALAGILVTLSLDEERVLCHLQDPIKGIVLVFSLVYYFFFCRKMMSLQRIFSSTTIIVGLFISVDYGLCDEFRCRGREVSVHNISIKGAWRIKAIWTFVYAGALAIFAIYYTLLEQHYTNGQQNVCSLLSSQQNTFLYTVSRLVSSRDIRRRGGEEEGGRLLHVTDPDPTIKPKTHPKPPILLTLLQIHFITLVIILLFSWAETINGIGRGLTPGELYESMKQGLLCHLKGSESCINVSGHGWIFLFSYIAFSISMLNFLAMSESAVFSVAAATVSLPLSGVWWSIYQMNVGTNGGIISWSPGVTGELICALLGLPVVLLGLGLLIKSHFKDSQPPSSLGSQHLDVHYESCQR